MNLIDLLLALGNICLTWNICHTCSSSRCLVRLQNILCWIINVDADAGVCDTRVARYYATGAYSIRRTNETTFIERLCCPRLSRSLTDRPTRIGSSINDAPNGLMLLIDLPYGTLTFTILW